MKRLKYVVELNLVLGAWLIVAPFVLSYSTSTIALVNDVALGVLFLGCSWWNLAASTGQVSASTCELLGGLWLIAGPFLLHYDRLSRAFANDIAVGILSLLVGAMETWMFVSRSRRVA